MQFKVGDRVRIKTLLSKKHGRMDGILGHVGEVTSINEEGYCYLSPHCRGACWPHDCLEYAALTVDQALEQGVISPETAKAIKECTE